MFLSEKEIQELTGYKTKKCQAKWLRNNGFKYVLDRWGKPKVMIEHVNSVLGTTGRTNTKRRVEPNMEGLIKMGWA